MLAVIVSLLLATHLCLWAIATTQCFVRLAVNTHISNVQRSMGSVDFFLPLFVAGAVNGVGVVVNVLSVAEAGAAAGIVFFFFFFVLTAVGGEATMGGEDRGHNDDLDLIPRSLCNVRCWRQRDARSSGGSCGNDRGCGRPPFGIGKVGRQPPHSVVGLADQGGEINGALQVFTCRNRPEDAVLSMDGDPP